ncbi:MAG: (2Fe-2S)-binding protein [Treponemataceae bacterium]
MSIQFSVNGVAIQTSNNPLQRAIDFIRDDLHLTGTKEGCGEGECGACAILVNGRVINACLVPLHALEGKVVVTIEHYVQTAQGKVVAKAFEMEGAVQCGFCTPGMVLSAQAILAQTKGQPTEHDIRVGLSGNLCRCTGYDHIVDAVQAASETGASLW